MKVFRLHCTWVNKKMENFGYFLLWIWHMTDSNLNINIVLKTLGLKNKKMENLGYVVLWNRHMTDLNLDIYIVLTNVISEPVSLDKIMTCFIISVTAYLEQQSASVAPISKCRTKVKESCIIYHGKFPYFLWSLTFAEDKRHDID